MQGLSDNPETSNAHVGHSGNRSSTKTILPLSWLPVAFFDRYHSEAKLWALPTFEAWIDVVKPHIHAGTTTVLGGPRGVRTMVFALSRILQNLRAVEARVAVPAHILAFFYEDNNRWDPVLAVHQTTQCILQLSHQVLNSCRILETSYAVRSEAWEDSVKLRYQQWESNGREIPSGSLARGVNTTSGVPESVHAVEAMWEKIQSRQADGEELDAIVEASRVINRSEASQAHAGTSGSAASVENLNLRNVSQGVVHSVRSSTKSWMRMNRRGQAEHNGRREDHLQHRAGINSGGHLQMTLNSSLFH